MASPAPSTPAVGLLDFYTQKISAGTQPAAAGGAGMERGARAKTELTKWCYDHNVILPRGSKNDMANYLTFDGFMLRVPEALEPEFLAEYARCVLLAKKNCFMIEKRTPVYRMHFDLDCVQPEAVSSDAVEQWCRVFMSAIRAFYPDAASTCMDMVVMAAVNTPPLDPAAHKVVTGADGSTPCVKCGFHVIMPRLLVTMKEALTLRAACVAAFIKHFGQRVAPCNSVEDLLDECVHRANGLRMMGSKKMVPCKSCKRGGGGARGGCMECHGTKRQVEDRVYLPTMVMSETHGIALVTAEQDVLKMLKMCAVRELAREEGVEVVITPMTVPPGAPVPAFFAAKTSTVRKVGDKRDLNYAGCAFKEDGAPRSSTKFCVDIPAHTELAVEMLAAARRVDPLFKDILFKDIKCDADRTVYVCRTLGWGSSYCLNVKRDHNTNTIWFQFSDKAGLTQRCFSDKACPAGCSARCKVYASPPVRISDPLRSALFPNSKEQKKKDAAAVVHVAKMLAFSSGAGGGGASNISFSSTAAAAASQESSLSWAADDQAVVADDKPLSSMTALEISQLSMRELVLAQRREKGEGRAKAKRMRDEAENVILPKAKKLK